MAKRTLLFLCTGNCCRSPLAEAIARDVAGDKFEVHSAGAIPAGYIHPLTLSTLDQLGISADGLSSKSWDEYVDKPIDIAIMLCEFASAAGPRSFPGGGVKVDWPLNDPSIHPGGEREQLEMTFHMANRLRLKIERLAALDLDRLTPEALKAELVMLADL